jgi:hypothetical protein
MAAEWNQLVERQSNDRLRRGDRGQFVKITEDVRGRRDTIMVPAEILDEFIEALQAVHEATDLED